MVLLAVMMKVIVSMTNPGAVRDKLGIFIDHLEIKIQKFMEMKILRDLNERIGL